MEACARLFDNVRQDDRIVSTEKTSYLILMGYLDEAGRLHKKSAARGHGDQREFETEETQIAS